ncbi:hypothetical protein [Alloyangia pacifica]|uniref:DUF4278 domain-containing protein n=1 Tax=Alloyangia pacifica TaxID=311180 RepID=A0A1I6WPJ7_9RHOB|nr:hypothetical protein [Alloyangia pacifica]SDI96952.1 hypothetical protein SAMN04488245_1363 [Alloyangia pacifica]SFT27464.1 hypothetical protein SAMN04488050_1316 [Alloyangia pacifica]
MTFAMSPFSISGQATPASDHKPKGHALRYRGVAYHPAQRSFAVERIGRPMIYRGIAYFGEPRVEAPAGAKGERRYRGVVH